MAPSLQAVGDGAREAGASPPPLPGETELDVLLDGLGKRLRLSQLDGFGTLVPNGGEASGLGSRRSTDAGWGCSTGLTWHDAIGSDLLPDVLASPVLRGICDDADHASGMCKLSWQYEPLDRIPRLSQLLGSCDGEEGDLSAACSAPPAPAAAGCAAAQPLAEVVAPAALTASRPQSITQPVTSPQAVRDAVSPPLDPLSPPPSCQLQFQLLQPLQPLQLPQPAGSAASLQLRARTQSSKPSTDVLRAGMLLQAAFAPSPPARRMASSPMVTTAGGSAGAATPVAGTVAAAWPMPDEHVSHGTDCIVTTAPKAIIGAAALQDLHAEATPDAPCLDAALSPAGFRSMRRHGALQAVRPRRGSRAFASSARHAGHELAVEPVVTPSAPGHVGGPCALAASRVLTRSQRKASLLPCTPLRRGRSRRQAIEDASVSTQAVLRTPLSAPPIAGSTSQRRAARCPASAGCTSAQHAAKRMRQVSGSDASEQLSSTPTVAPRRSLRWG